MPFLKDDLYFVSVGKPNTAVASIDQKFIQVFVLLLFNLFLRFWTEQKKNFYLIYSRAKAKK